MPESGGHIGEVAAILASHMAARKTETEPGVVFILGAGCSMQYGLPGFDRLVRNVYEEIHKSPPDSEEDFNALRQNLESYWRFTAEEECERLLHLNLSGVKGNYCPGYRYLARLAKKEYVQAIVNMNFDPLLSHALEAEECAFTPGCEWPNLLKDKKLAVITPHGTLAAQRPKENKFILDIGSSNLFLKLSEEKKARQFLHRNHVVIIGYAGGDATIAQSLLGFSGNDVRKHQKNNEGPSFPYLFVINPVPPNAQLLRAISERRAAELYATGPDANFENFMSLLNELLLGAEPRTDSEKPTTHKPIKIVPDFGYEEETALQKCNQLAHYIRSTMNVAEASRITLEEHGQRIFQECNKLAAAMDLPLTPPEKFLIQATAYFHDLGYFAAYSGNGAHAKSGLKLLLQHGNDTAALLEEQFKEVPELIRTIIPQSYPRWVKDVLLAMLIELCRHHSFPYGFEAPSGPAKKGDLPPFELSSESHFRLHRCHETEFVKIDEFKFPVRFDLIHALFAAAEELSEGHPFFPSPYSLESTSLQQAIEDPILSLYLDQTARDVTFKIEHGKIVALIKPDPQNKPSNSSIWLCGTAKDAIGRLNEVAAKLLPEIDKGKSRNRMRLDLKPLPPAATENVGGVEVFRQKRGTFDEELFMNELCGGMDSYIPGRWDQKHLIKGALEDRLKDLVAKLLDMKDKTGLAAGLLDLIAIYTLPGGTSEAEPRAELGSPTVKGASQTYDALEDKNHRGLLELYFQRKIEGKGKASDEVEALDAFFIESFDEIYYPAWRFCAKSWRAWNDPICMGRVALDIGSSRYRGEVISGLRYLMYDKIFLETLPRENEAEIVVGHERCMLCTSRLLYILSSARLLFPTDQLNLVARQGDLSPDVLVNRILNYMLNLNIESPEWWGQQLRDGEDDEVRHKIKSADYIAWAIRALAFTLKVVHENELHGDQTWSGEIPVERRDRMIGRVRQLLEKLASDKTTGAILNPNAEEPHPYIVGELGTTYLFLSEVAEELGLGNEWSLQEHVKGLNDAVNELCWEKQPQLSRFFMWPALVFLHHACPESREELEEKMGKTLGDCLGNQVWIRKGSGSGSWGGNLENTQRIVSSLNTFWRYVYSSRQNQKRFGKLLKDSVEKGEITAPA